MALDKIHTVGMSENGSTYLTVNEHEGVAVEPPIQVVFEGSEASSIAVSQDALAARYDEEQLQEIGEGSSILGLKRVIGDIATGGMLEHNATKPLHPTLIDADIVAPRELPLHSSLWLR